MADQAEQLRKLALQPGMAESRNPATGPRSLALVSGKGGVGKSTLAIQLSAGLHERGQRVLLIDADLQSPSLHVLANLNPQLTVGDVLTYGKPPGGITFQRIEEGWELFPNQVTKAVPDVADRTNAPHFLELLQKFTAGYDFLIFDLHTGLNSWNLNIIRQMHEVLLLTLVDPTSVIETYTLVKAALPYVPTGTFSLLVSQVLSQRSGPECHRKLNLALQHFLNLTIPYFGHTPFDRQLRAMISEQEPFWRMTPENASYQAVSALIPRLLHSELNQPKDEHLLMDEVKS